MGDITSTSRGGCDSSLAAQDFSLYLLTQ
ncbi:hypothetical protein ID866_7882 [Astraeus odoratus]|nr:hypothetical protein ID866_7882 [Astraeus odoratus]